MSIGIAAAATTASPQVWSGASMRMPASQKMANLFDQIDTSNSGSISQAQFNQAFQTLNPPKDFKAAGAEAIWSQLDPTKSGSVSKQDFINGMTTMMRQMRASHHPAGATAASSAAPGSQTVAHSAALLQSLLPGSQLNVKA